MSWTVVLNFFAALLAIVDPLGNIPIYATLTADNPPPVQCRLAVMITLFVVVALLVFFFVGSLLLQTFGISIPAFRIAGGILLLQAAIGVQFILAEIAPTLIDAGTLGTS